MARIVILGSGFAALSTVKALRKQGYRETLTLVSPKAELFFYPSLIWVPAGLRSEADLTVPLDAYFRRQNVEHLAAAVTGLDLAAKKVLTGAGEVAYDYLVVASGSRFIKKLPGIEHVHIPCESYASVAAYGDRLRRMEGGHLAFGFAGNPNEPSAMRGGPVFEFLFGVDTLLRQQGRRDKFQLTFFSPAAEPGKRLGEKAVANLLAEMGRRDIHAHLGHKMKGFGENSVQTEGGDFAADLTFFMPGLTGPAWLEGSGLPLSPGGFIQADETCRVPGVAGVYVAGDAGSFPGPDWLPKQAHMADLQAVAAAKNLLSDLGDRPERHAFKPELVCIVDTLASGVLIYRSPARGLLFKAGLLHWAKVAFEKMYLAQYR
jgi:sulfide:quinone oxidoreductase